MKKIIGLAFLLCAGFAQAEETGFMTHTELGYVSTSGNTNTKTGTVDFSGKKSWHISSVQLDLDYLYGESDGIENKNRLISEINYDYKLADNLKLNYLIGYKDDKFSGYEYQFYTGPGVKYLPIDSDEHKLSFQGNILYAMDSGMDKYYDAAGAEIKYPYVNPPKSAATTIVGGEDNEYTSYLLKGDYTWQIMPKTLKFIQTLSYRGDFEEAKNYFIFSKTGLQSKINSMFSMGVSYKVDYTNLPPAGNEHTTKTFALSLIIDY